jgi:hypothetical protein
MDMGLGAGVGVKAMVGRRVGASVGARVGTLVGAAVAVSRTGFARGAAGLHPLITIKKMVSPTPNVLTKYFFISSASTACLY